MATSHQISHLLSRCLDQGVDPYNTLDCAKDMQARHQSHHNASRARVHEAEWMNDLAILRRQAD